MVYMYKIYNSNNSNRRGAEGLFIMYKGTQYNLVENRLHSIYLYKIRSERNENIESKNI